MGQTYKIKLPNNAFLIVESEQLIEKDKYEEGISKTGALKELRDKALEQVIEVSDSVLDKIAQSLAHISTTVIDQFLSNSGENKPSAVAIEFGVNIAGELDIKLAKNSATSNLKVTLTWENQECK